MKRIAVVVSHPIQYNSPVFKLLAASEGIVLKVFYTWGQSQGRKFDPGFGREIDWDIPLLEGYDYVFMENTSAAPGSHHFKGIVNPGLTAAIAGFNPDLLLVYGWSFQSHLAVLRHFKGKVPIIFRGDSTLLDERPGFKKALRRVFLRWIYRHVDYALYTGTRNREYFISHGLKGDRLIFAPHAIDNDRFAGTGSNWPPDMTAAEAYKKQAASMRRELGFTDDDRVVLFAGKLESKKNPFFLLMLADRISDPRLKFLVTGNGVLEQEFKQRATRDGRFVFLDFQNQGIMPVIYRLGDVFILPSSGPGETWGLAVNEAMASGLPVIVSDKTGCAVDLVQEGLNGTIIRNGEAEPVAAFLSAALGDPGLLKEMGARSKTLIEPFNNRRFVTAIRELIAQTEAATSEKNKIMDEINRK
jgi:glycosyltransferase involved in cell wall biosynthesis